MQGGFPVPCVVPLYGSLPLARPVAQTVGINHGSHTTLLAMIHGCQTMTEPCHWFADDQSAFMHFDLFRSGGRTPILRQVGASYPSSHRFSHRGAFPRLPETDLCSARQSRVLGTPAFFPCGAAATPFRAARVIALVSTIRSYEATQIFSHDESKRGLPSASTISSMSSSAMTSYVPYSC